MYLKRIADLREDNDLTQKEVALFLGVHRSTYSKWENGDNNIPLLLLDKLAVKYDVSLEYIFGFQNEKKNKNITYNKLNKNILCLNMKIIRKRHKYTQTKMAKKLLVSKATYSRYERGLLIIPIDKFYMLEGIFGISLDAIAGKSKLKEQNTFTSSVEDNKIRL